MAGDRAAGILIVSETLFLVRVFFGDRRSAARLEAVLDEYAAQASAPRPLRGVADRLVDRPQAAFRRATALFGVRREQAKLDWIAEVRPLLTAAIVGCDGSGGERALSFADDPAASGSYPPHPGHRRW